MKKQVKYWLFYICEELINSFDYLLTVKYDLESTSGIKGYYNLYAYTDDEKLMKTFCKTRDMKKFTIKERILDVDEIRHLAIDFRYDYLGKYKFTTRGKEVGIVCTEGEYKLISTYTSFFTVNPQRLLQDKVPIRIFKKEVIDLFDKTGVSYLNKALDGDIIPSLDNCPFRVDLLYVFLHVFGKLMKG